MRKSFYIWIQSTRNNSLVYQNKRVGIVVSGGREKKTRANESNVCNALKFFLYVGDFFISGAGFDEGGSYY